MPSRATEVHRIFLLAVDCAGDERERALAAACGDDAALRAEVEALLRSDTADSFLAEDQLAVVRRKLGDDGAGNQHGGDGDSSDGEVHDDVSRREDHATLQPRRKKHRRQVM